MSGDPASGDGDDKPPPPPRFRWLGKLLSRWLGWAGLRGDSRLGRAGMRRRLRFVLLLTLSMLVGRIFRRRRLGADGASVMERVLCAHPLVGASTRGGSTLASAADRRCFCSVFVPPLCSLPQTPTSSAA
eukprot:SAG11_NODE_385_length_9888_cov_13.326387_8_plen_130_part_00